MGQLSTNEVPPNPSLNPEEFQEFLEGGAQTALVAEKRELSEGQIVELLKNSDGDMFIRDGHRLYQILRINPEAVYAKCLETGRDRCFLLSPLSFFERIMNERDVLEKS